MPKKNKTAGDGRQKRGNYHFFDSGVHIYGLRLHYGDKVSERISPPKDAKLWFRTLLKKIDIGFVGYACEDTGAVSNTGIFPDQFLSCFLQWSFQSDVPGNWSPKIAHNIPSNRIGLSGDFTILIQICKGGNVCTYPAPEWIWKNTQLDEVVDQHRTFLYNLKAKINEKLLILDSDDELWIELETKKVRKFEKGTRILFENYAQRGILVSFDDAMRHINTYNDQSDEIIEAEDSVAGTEDIEASVSDGDSSMIGEDGVADFTDFESVRSRVTKVKKAKPTTLDFKDFSGLSLGDSVSAIPPRSTAAKTTSMGVDEKLQDMLRQLSAIKVELAHNEDEMLRLKERQNVLKVAQQGLIDSLQEHLQELL